MASFFFISEKGKISISIWSKNPFPAVKFGYGLNTPIFTILIFSIPLHD